MWKKGKVFLIQTMQYQDKFPVLLDYLFTHNCQYTGHLYCDNTVRNRSMCFVWIWWMPSPCVSMKGEVVSNYLCWGAIANLLHLRLFFVLGQIAVTRPSRVHFKCHRNVIVSPDSCERHRRRGRKREFHLLLSEARRETRAPPSERSASSLTDHWYLGSKRNGNESKSGGIIIPSERFSICHKRRSPGLGNFPPRIYGEHKRESYAIFSFLRDERQVGGSSSRLEGMGWVGGGVRFFSFLMKSRRVSVCECVCACVRACVCVSSFPGLQIAVIREHQKWHFFLCIPSTLLF